MDLLTCAEAADLAGVSERSLRKWARDGRIKRHDGPDGRVRYSRAELEAVQSQAPCLVPPRTRPPTSRVPGCVKGEEPAARERESALVSALRQVLEEANRHVTELHRELRTMREREAALIEEVATLRAQKEERERLVAEVGFLRAQLEGSREAEGILRVLMLRQSEQLQALTEPEPSLPALPEPAGAKRVWGRFLGRLFRASSH
jgi:helix-turn-helix protein